MKLTKKLLPALGMLALSTCMMVTSTFAWFSINEDVTATGMSVQAKGEQVYLQIIDDKTTSSFQNGKATPPVSANTLPDASILPTSVRPATVDEQGTITADVDDDYAGGTPGWVYAIGTAHNNGAALDGEYTDVSNKAETNNGKYFIKNTFYIRLDPTAGAVKSAALRVENITVSSSVADKAFSKSLSVLVVATIKDTEDSVDTVMGDLWQYNTQGTFAHVEGTDATLSDGDFTVITKGDAEYAKIDIYVFFDGDNANCNLQDLADVLNQKYSVVVDFTVEAEEVEEDENA